MQSLQETLIDYLEGGDTLDEFLEQYPGVSRELFPCVPTQQVSFGK